MLLRNRKRKDQARVLRRRTARDKENLALGQKRKKEKSRFRQKAPAQIQSPSRNLKNVSGVKKMESKKLKGKKRMDLILETSPGQNPEPIPKTQEAQVAPSPKDLFTNFKYPSAYSGDIQKFLLANEAVSRHRKRIKKFDRRRTRVNGPYTAIQVDTIFGL